MSDVCLRCLESASDELKLRAENERLREYIKKLKQMIPFEVTDELFGVESEAST